MSGEPKSCITYDRDERGITVKGASPTVTQAP
jgi:hypothetical protein